MTTTLNYDPALQDKETIYVTANKSAWINIQHLPTSLKEYASSNFEKMFECHPEKRGTVMVFNQDTENPKWVETECSRWYQSYLNTAQFDKSVMKSYMFSGSNNTNINGELPNIFQPFYSYMKDIDAKNNQVVINWYDNKNDYIPYHSDCEAHMVENHTISLINLNAKDSCRLFKFQSKNQNETLYEEVNVVLRHGIVITMGGDLQSKYRHGVPACDENVSPRISMSFRQF